WSSDVCSSDLKAIDALPRRAACALARPLVGDAAEKLPFGIIAAALVPVVAGDRDVLLVRHADDVRVRERERTARDAVVSGTAERMAVHFPQDQGLALGGGFRAGLPEARQP